MENEVIPVCEPFLAGREREYVMEAVESGWISSSGKYISRFEQAFADFIGVKYGIATCNGTTALHLSLEALDIGPGDEIIIPDFTMIASAFAVCHAGATPVFVDAERRTWNINPDLVEKKVSKRTKAIMAVHIYGHSVDMDPLSVIAKKYGICLIEDAAEVHGAEYKGRKCGSLGDVAAFSFYANKIITTGEGGMVVTNDEQVAKRCRSLKNLSFPDSKDRVYLHETVGFNYRMSNIHAALGLAQMENAADYIERRRQNNRVYRELLRDVPEIRFQEERDWAKNVYWMNGIVVEKGRNGITRDQLIGRLQEQGIETRRFFVGMHRQPSLRKFCDVDDDFPVSNELTESGLYLPSGSGLTDDQIRRVSFAVREAFRR